MKAARKMKLICLIGLFFGLGLNNTLLAQEQFVLTGKTELKVMGGSTIHDWEMASAKAQGKADMLVDGTVLKNVRSASISMKAESLKSGKGKMDEIAYDALNTKKHSDILFVLTSFRNLDNKRAQATGNLTIAGTTKPVTFNVETSVKGANVYMVGETAIKFTDFKINPPTALLGTVKTTNDLKLAFKVNFQPNTISQK